MGGAETDVGGPWAGAEWFQKIRISNTTRVPGQVSTEFGVLICDFQGQESKCDYATELGVYDSFTLYAPPTASTCGRR